MAKVIGKRILPGGNIIIKNITNGSGKDISTPLIIKEDKIKSPFKVITQEKIINQDVSVSSFGNGLSNVIGTSSREIHFRKFIGSGITEISLLGYDVKISAARATIETSSLGGVSLGLAVSGGTGNRNELRIRGLTGGGIIEVSALANSIVISAAPGSFTQNITNSAFGGGINPILAISANSEIHTRTFTGGGIVEVSAATDGRIIVSGQGVIKTLVNQISHGFSQGNVVYLDNDDGLWKLAISTSADTLGVALVNLIDSDNFEAVFAGTVTGFTGLIPGNFYFTSDVSAGSLQITEPSVYSNPIFYSLTTTTGIVLPYRPYEKNPLPLLAISGLGTGASVLRNVEGQTIVHRTLVNTSTVQVSASNSTIEFNVISDNIAIPERIYFRAGDFDNPNNSDWYVSALAPAISDTLNNALTVRSFNNSSPYKGVGGIVRIPDSRYSNVRFGFVIRTPVAPVSPSGVVFGFGFRNIPNNNIISSWVVTSLPVFTIPTNTNYQYFVTSAYSIIGLGMNNNQLVQFEIWRIYDNASDTLTTNAYLLEFYFEFTG